MFCQIKTCDPESWWLTGFQHEMRYERRQLRWLNYGLSRQQSFSRSQKQMSAIYGPPFIMASLNQSTCIIPSISCWWSCTLQPGDWNETKVRLLSFSSINLYNPFNFVFTQISVATYRHYHNVSHVMYSWQSDIHLEGWNVEVLHAKLHMLLSFKRGNCEIKGLEHLGIISLLPSIGILTS